MKHPKPLVDIEHLEVSFTTKQQKWLNWRSTPRQVRAVDDVSFRVHQGETVGLLGESGSGKTTVGRAILRALEPTGGTITFHKEGDCIDISQLKGATLRAFRPNMSLIFQDPYSSLNPRMTVRDIIAEPLVVSGLVSDRDEIDAKVRDMAVRCKLNIEHLRSFPHAFSGGQRQRICIARALITEPKFVVCDESVSALDVSIQAGIINLLKDLQEETGVSFLFIAHDLSVVAQISHRVAVMYVGKLMELAPTQSLFFSPYHPYTNALMQALPRIDSDQKLELPTLQGEIPDPSDLPKGCRFHTRCPFVQQRCHDEEPMWQEIKPQHFVACHFAKDMNFSRPV